MKAQTGKFSKTELFRCPLCGGGLECSLASLVCPKGHCFDISSKGYVNFLPGGRQPGEYDAGFFESRRLIMEAGFYDHLAEALASRILPEKPSVVVDAGCGEGFYSLRFARQAGAEVVAFDFSADAVRLAAKGGNPVLWTVADITNIPLRDGCADILFDIYTPSNYGEFARVLAKDGVVIKVIPGAEHLRELRQAAGDSIKSGQYSNRRVVDHFCRHFKLVEHVTVTKMLPVSPGHVETLLAMTPLLFHVDKATVDCAKLREITIEGELLIGKRL